MSVEKISATTPITNNLPAKVEEKTATPCAEPDKKLSDSAKLMIGATLLAGTIAIGIIGHKNNWWRKAVREGENLSSSANHNTHTLPDPVQPHPNPDPVQPHADTLPDPTGQTETIVTENADTVARPQLSPVERLIAKVDSTLSKELKHAKHSLKQYNEVMDAVTETNQSFGGNYVKYLESKGYTVKNVDGKLFMRNGKGSLIIINNPQEGNRLHAPAFIEFFDKDGKLQKTVSFPITGNQNPLVLFYDKNEQVSKRIFNMQQIGCMRKPHIFVSYINNGRVTKEAVYIQPFKEGIDGDYTTSQVLNIAKYGKKKFEVGKVSVGDSPKYVFINEKPYLIQPDNSLKNCDMGNIFLNNRRQITFNKNNQIITRLDISGPEISGVRCKYNANDAKTGRELYELVDIDGRVDRYIASDLFTEKTIRKIYYEFYGKPECYTIIPFVNGKSAKDQIQIIHKSTFDTAPLYEPFKADYAPDRIMEPNRF